ncbi:5'-nucleotidase C-terminal domain-containing protein [Prevotella corporis]|jgi:2',3'-cyclic-nucleotide 2'-phosphodiesterase (5'-nucleotidase family)|uniref:5'-nucleotidase C-terminal domain-containing protein n=1 Tax=Prevotella corporis TaxID=28128 RepID=UPI0023F4D4D4|nr:5'-nucleotidase [Prevotella corporis]
MSKKFVLMGGLGVIMAFASCTTHYQLTTIDRSRILIDQRYDVRQDTKAVAFLAPYKHQVDSIMGPVVAHSHHYMKAERPESDLSNLLADIMVWGAKAYNEKVDFAVYNMGGIRAGLPAGDVTYGDVLDIAPFENKICFLTLTGDKVMELFNQIAHVGGEGVSKGVSLVLSKNNTLLHAYLNGKEIDLNAKYRIATIDYLAQGNDKLEAFKAKTDFNSPQEESNNSRYIILNYFKELTSQGKVVDSRTEGRIAYLIPNKEVAIGVAP